MNEKNLSDLTDEELNAEIARRKKAKEVGIVREACLPASPVGNWEVTTEGFKSGRTDENLGVYSGHILDIALALADRACHRLYFRPAQKLPEITTVKADSVEIFLLNNSALWNLPDADRKATFSEWLCRDKSKTNFTVSVNPGGFFQVKKETKTVDIIMNGGKTTVEIPYGFEVVKTGNVEANDLLWNLREFIPAPTFRIDMPVQHFMCVLRKIK